MYTQILSGLDEQLLAAGFAKTKEGWILPKHWHDEIKKEIVAYHGGGALTSSWRRKDAWQFYIVYLELHNNTN